MNPRRGRRPGAFRERIALRFLRRSVTDRLAIWPVDQRRLTASRRRPPPQKRHVPHRVRRDPTRPDARADYQCTRDEGKKHNAAVICVARRCSNLTHAGLTTATPTTHHDRRSLQKSLDNKTGTPQDRQLAAGANVSALWRQPHYCRDGHRAARQMPAR